MHRIRTIAKQVLKKTTKNPLKKKKYSDHRVSLKEGTQISHTISTPGFQLILTAIKEEIDNITSSWMDEESEKVREVLRTEASTWKKVLKKFDSYLQKREVARKSLRHGEDNLEPQ